MTGSLIEIKPARIHINPFDNIKPAEEDYRLKDSAGNSNNKKDKAQKE